MAHSNQHSYAQVKDEDLTEKAPRCRPTERVRLELLKRYLFREFVATTRYVHTIVLTSFKIPPQPSQPQPGGEKASIWSDHHFRAASESHMFTTSSYCATRLRGVLSTVWSHDSAIAPRVRKTSAKPRRVNCQSRYVRNTREGCSRRGSHEVRIRLICLAFVCVFLEKCGVNERNSFCSPVHALKSIPRSSGQRPLMRSLDKWQKRTTGGFFVLRQRDGYI